jgi:hypothetical protein
MGEEQVPSRRDADKSAIAALARMLDEGKVQEAAEMPVEYRHLEERLELLQIKLKRKYAKQEIELRRKYAWVLLAILAAQILVADTVFTVFADVGRRWRLSDGVIQIWLAATVIEIVGVVTVVTRHLFPGRNQPTGEDTVAHTEAASRSGVTPPV